MFSTPRRSYRVGRTLLYRAASIRRVMGYAVPRVWQPRSRVLDYAAPRPNEGRVTIASELRDIAQRMLAIVAGIALTPITWGILAVAFLWWMASAGDG